MNNCANVQLQEPDNREQTENTETFLIKDGAFSYRFYPSSHEGCEYIDPSDYEGEIGGIKIYYDQDKKSYQLESSVFMYQSDLCNDVQDYECYSYAPHLMIDLTHDQIQELESKLQGVPPQADINDFFDEASCLDNACVTKNIEFHMQATNKTTIFGFVNADPTLQCLSDTIERTQFASEVETLVKNFF